MAGLAPYSASYRAYCGLPILPGMQQVEVVFILATGMIVEPACASCATRRLAKIKIWTYCGCGKSLEGGALAYQCDWFGHTYHLRPDCWELPLFLRGRDTTGSPGRKPYFDLTS